MNSSDILEHYGVKGMRWGVRRSKPQSNSNSRSNTSQKKSKKISTAKALKIAAVTLTGAALATHLIAKHGKVKPNPSHLLNDNVNSFVKARLTPKVDPFAIPMGPIGSTSKMGKVKVKKTSDTARFIQDITKQHNETIRRANADLKANYERLQTPFPLREYIKEWT